MRHSSSRFRLTTFAATILLATFAGIAATIGAVPFKLLVLDKTFVRWLPKPDGRLLVTYAFATDEMVDTGARNCQRMTRLDGLQRLSGLDGETLQREVRAAFDLWEHAAGIDFEPAADVATADIVIGAQVSPKGIAFANVEREEAGAGHVGRIKRSTICLNPLQRWNVGFDGDLGSYDLRYVVGHEIGHAIGLDHPGSSGQLMSWSYDEKFRDLQLGDRMGIAKLYGQWTIPSAGNPHRGFRQSAYDGR